MDIFRINATAVASSCLVALARVGLESNLFTYIDNL
jgi:hypothetical protein